MEGFDAIEFVDVVDLLDAIALVSRP